MNMPKNLDVAESCRASPHRTHGHILPITVVGGDYLLCGLDDPQYEILRSTYGDATNSVSRAKSTPLKLTVINCDPGALSETKDIPLGEFQKFFHANHAGFYSKGIYAEVTHEDGLAGHLYLDPGLDPMSIWGIENLLRQLMAYKVFEEGGFLVHSAAIALNGLGYIFHGVSGAGKSTFSKQIIADGGSVLSDDLVMVFPAQNSWLIRRIPFSGELSDDECCGGDLPLTGIFSLSKGNQHQMLSTTLATMAAALMVCVPYLNHEPRHTVKLMDRLITVLRSVNYGSVEIKKGRMLSWLRSELGNLKITNDNR